MAQVEAWNVTSTLLFYDDRQELVLLDRFLNPISQLRLSEYLDGTVRVATLASDNHIWLLDESNLVLREFDPNTLRLMQSTPLDLLIGRSKPDFRFLRQYQNNTLPGGPQHRHLRVRQPRQLPQKAALRRAEHRRLSGRRAVLTSRRAACTFFTSTA